MVEACSLDLYPEENSWHFITVTPTIGDRVIAFAISVAITGMYVHSSEIRGLRST